MKSRLAVSFGEVADREMRHLSEGVSENLGASRKKASGVSAPVLGRKFSRAFLGRLTLGPGPVRAIRLGQLARGTELGPMVPTMPPFFLPGRKNIPGRKKRTSLIVIL